MLSQGIMLSGADPTRGEIVDISSLSTLADVQGEPHVPMARILTFRYDHHVRVTIRIVFFEPQSGADVTITNMTTLPERAMRKGYGQRSLVRLLTWCIKNGVRTIHATQVQHSSALFWKRCGFRPLNNQTHDYAYSA